MIEYSRMEQLQALPLEQKEAIAKLRIQQFYEKMDNRRRGKVYVSLSGKDSTVLLHLVRQVYPEVPAVFADTGLEFPEIREFIKNVDNVTWLKPKKPFTAIIKEYGYPVVSKEVSRYVYDLQHPTEKNAHTRRIRLEGSAFKGGKPRTGMISKKWQFLKDAPFNCGAQCCNVMKKQPMEKYQKETGQYPYIGTMAEDSRLRKQSYLKHGCNMYNAAKPQSRPLSIWTEANIWEYIKKYDIPYSSIYDMGYERTGCVFCMFGYWQERKRGIDRFEMLAETHPSLHKYCMEKLGMKEVIEYIDSHLKVQPKAKPLNEGQQELFI